MGYVAGMVLIVAIMLFLISPFLHQRYVYRKERRESELRIKITVLFHKSNTPMLEGQVYAQLKKTNLKSPPDYGEVRKALLALADRGLLQTKPYQIGNREPYALEYSLPEADISGNECTQPD